MKGELTIIESPYNGAMRRNKLYLRRCVLDSLSRGEVPFASHAFYTQFLDDNSAAERERGIQLGYEFWPYAQNIVFYTDYGMTLGMLSAHDRCVVLKKRYELRSIGKNGDKAENQAVEQTDAEDTD